MSSVQRSLRPRRQSTDEAKDWTGLRDIGLIVLVFILFVGGLEAFLRIFSIPRWILPTPSAIFSTLVTEFRPLLLEHLWVTLKEILGGFLIAAPLGIILGAFIAQFKILEKLLTPYIVLLVTTPMLALMPLLMLMFGFGLSTKIIVVVVAAFPPIMMNAIVGYTTTDQLKLDLMASMGASRSQIFWTVRFPNALPSIFTGLVIGGITSVITAVGAEFVGGSEGLGNRLLYFSSLLQTELSYACIVLLAVVGVAIYLAITSLQKLVITWKL